MKPLIEKGGDASWRKEIYYHYYELSFGLTKHYGIRTDRYKLIHFYGDIDSWELYDLKKDPHEMHNLYNNAAMTSTVSDLKNRLYKLAAYYKDNTL
ncbi:DUF4976 domain-containing protein [Niabella ginsengisoli]|uniref:DUF4976 domain-containing protein n=2 Tax=Niabella ginsengisoli TaxID=522298 RepID=A0ABS9SKM9_9BACT|nr:DUF4976 domain-containing protein [Niabella ginsengisoli]